MWRFMGFDTAELSGNRFCVEIDPASSIFCLTEKWVSLKIMIFDILGKSLHHQMILGPPDGSLDFSKHQRLLVERPSAKIHFGK